MPGETSEIPRKSKESLSLERAPIDALIEASKQSMETEINERNRVEFVKKPIALFYLNLAGVLILNFAGPKLGVSPETANFVSLLGAITTFTTMFAYGQIERKKIDSLMKESIEARKRVEELKSQIAGAPQKKKNEKNKTKPKIEVGEEGELTQGEFTDELTNQTLENLINNQENDNKK